ncbi:hypothetical protein FQN54_009738 [Arachnomyces sp. PD_36]|nr:hypothetical protein FQN54_009738 [Arachnomyces sp. PD_36]
MRSSQPLPLPNEWEDAESYVDSLLSFSTTSDIFRHLCGGVHILDFLTRDPDLYTSLIPEDWRLFFAGHEIGDILHLLMKEDIQSLQDKRSTSQAKTGDDEESPQWRGGPIPPPSLLEYIHDIRRHSLKREFTPREPKLQTPQKGFKGTIPRHIAVGMKPKKAHEVENFSRYVDSLTADISQATGEPVSHIADFGSGQNYLGRTLASPPYNRNVIAIERRHHNISGARDKDIHAKLSKKKKVIFRNKKLYQEQLKAGKVITPGTDEAAGISEEIATLVLSEKGTDTPVSSDGADANGDKKKQKENRYTGSMDYIEHDIQDGYLEPIIRHVVEPGQETPNGREEEDTKLNNGAPLTQPRVLVISLHSCGNLVHHGVRSLIMNPSVSAVAMIGCCYNLMTERLGPLTYKLPTLRYQHPRLESASSAYDPHGFPMSHRLETLQHDGGEGMRLNITARMMAVQAPYNWGPEESEAFFTRHFFRALLQRIFLDRGVVEQPRAPEGGDTESKNTRGTPLIIGSLRKAAFTSFTAYVRAAVSKMVKDEAFGSLIQERVSNLSDEEIEKYDQEYRPAKKNLSVVWSLMAFSAGVVESIIVVDRWLYLREQESVKECWVEPVFDYSQSPRNLAVIGIKK